MGQAPIIIKKKVVHGGHHGGAWKVAYADFVTAMMALFIVLWLMNSSKDIRKAIGGYFQDPNGTSHKMGTTLAGTAENFSLTKDNMSKLKDELEKAVRQTANFDKIKNQIEMTVTSEGLRVELLEGQAGTFFGSGVAAPTDSGKEILLALAQELGKLPNKIAIEGHTDSQPFLGRGDYSNWELSSDRANAARRLMQENGLGPQQVTQVRGYADQRLRKPQDPTDPSNRRISLIVQYLAKPEPEPSEAKPATAASHG